MTNMSLLKNDTVFARRESNVRSYCRRLGVVFDTARGSLIIDESGRQYVDFLAGCASLNYGHNDPDMKQALLDHIMRDGIAHGLDLFTPAKRKFLEDFESLILEPRGLEGLVVSEVQRLLASLQLREVGEGEAHQPI